MTCNCKSRGKHDCTHSKDDAKGLVRRMYFISWNFHATKNPGLICVASKEGVKFPSPPFTFTGHIPCAVVNFFSRVCFLFFLLFQTLLITLPHSVPFSTRKIPIIFFQDR